MWRFAWALSSRSSVLFVVGAFALHLYGAAVFLCSPSLEGSTPSLSDMICPELVQCATSLLGKPLFVLKHLFAFSLSGSFLSAHPPTHGGGGLLGLDGVREGDLGRAAWWVPVAGSVAPSSCVGRVPRVPETMHV